MSGCLFKGCEVACKGHVVSRAVHPAYLTEHTHMGAGRAVQDADTIWALGEQRVVPIVHDHVWVGV